MTDGEILHCYWSDVVVVVYLFLIVVAALFTQVLLGESVIRTYNFEKPTIITENGYSVFQYEKCHNFYRFYYLPTNYIDNSTGLRKSSSYLGEILSEIF